MQKVFELAKAEIGTFEWAEGSNPKVDAYFDDVGHPTMQDDVSWCAAFAGSMLKRAGFPHTGKLTARSYLDWGVPVPIEDAEEGDIVVFWRGSRNSWQGHVAFFVEKKGKQIAVLGGNQRDQVNIANYPADRVLGVRRMTKTSKLQSTTLQAAGGAAVSGAGGVGVAVGYLDGTAQIMVIGFAIFAALCIAWVARERIKKFARGDR